MRVALILTAVFIFYGSAYPFNFHFVPLNLELLRAFFATWRVQSPLIDIFANVLLFVAFGGVGILAFPRRPVWVRISLVGAGGLTCAVVSQIAQFYVPGRVPALHDVLWNMIGLMIGLGFGGAATGLLRRWQRLSENALMDPVPLFLIGLWLVVRLLPFVPTFNLQAYKHSLHPLFPDPVFVFHSFLVDAAAWLTIALLLMDLRGTRRVAVLLAALGATSLALEVVIVANTVALTDIVALGAALLIVVTIVRWVPSPAVVAVAMMLIALVYNGLEPFRLSGEIDHFRWVPFGATLSGNLLVSAKIISIKLFFYGALVWLIVRSCIGSSLLVVAVVTSIVVGIEVAQLVLISHTPEITDPILVLLCAAIIYTSRRSGVPVTGEPAGAAQR